MMTESMTSKHGVTVSIGDFWFMQSPESKRWPRAFPERHWMFFVNSLNNNSPQGPSINYKRKGSRYVSRDIDEFGSDRFIDNGQEHGFRKATDDEIAYFLKRNPAVKKRVEEQS